MERLLSLERQLVSGSSGNLDVEELKRIVFGPNYAERDIGFEVLRKNNMLRHYHITEDSK